MMGRLDGKIALVTGAAFTTRFLALEAEMIAKDFARPEEIATTVLNLVTDDAAYVTGYDTLVDGGYTAR